MGWNKNCPLPPPQKYLIYPKRESCNEGEKRVGPNSPEREVEGGNFLDGFSVIDIDRERERAYSCGQRGRERKDVLRAEGEDPSM